MQHLQVQKAPSGAFCFLERGRYAVDLVDAHHDAGCLLAAPEQVAIIQRRDDQGDVCAVRVDGHTTVLSLFSVNTVALPAIALAPLG